MSDIGSDGDVESLMDDHAPVRKRKKRRADPSNWINQKAKTCRQRGKAYVSPHTGPPSSHTQPSIEDFSRTRRELYQRTSTTTLDTPKTLKMIQLVLVLVLVAVGTVAGESCQPVCDGVEAAGNKTADPMDCSRYYMCLADGTPSDFSLECTEEDDGPFFNAEIGECDTDDTKCAYCEPKCAFTCGDDPGQLAAVKGDCNSFTLCSMGLVVPCNPAKPFFNGEECVEDESQCCDGCKAYCEVEFVEIPDSYNCTNYYYCSHVGYPNVADLYHCPEGEVFNATTGHCQAGTECTALCGKSYVTPTTPTTLAPSSHCTWSHLCTEVGYFPVCTNACDPHYFRCISEHLNEVIAPILCPSGKTLDPIRMRCVDPSECPF